MAGSSSAAAWIGVTTVLLIAVTALFAGRVYQRHRQRRFRWDDYSITGASVLALIEWALITAATTPGPRHEPTSTSRDPSLRAHHLTFASELIWIPAAALVKIGIAFTVLHFRQARPWRIALSVLIATQVLFCVVELVFTAVQCVPLDYLWSDSHQRAAVCTASAAVLASQYVHAGVSTATDLGLALTPLSFAQRGLVPTREGVLALLIATLGLVATASSALRITLLDARGGSSDHAAPVAFWGLVEVQIALLAANIAAFKAVPVPPAPLPLHYGAPRRRRHSTVKGRRASALSREDPYALPSLHKRGLGVGTNVSSPTGSGSLSSTLKRTRSEEVIWPRESKRAGSDEDGSGHDDAFGKMLAAGGILMTRELDVRSEVLSQSGSSVGRSAGRGDGIGRREEWAIVEDEERVRGDWSAV